jgi:hypothetical protein
MKKRLLTLLLVCALLPLASTTVYAKESQHVEGTLDYTFEVTSMREAGPNIFMEATEHEIWQGDLAGEGDSVFTVGMFKDFWTVRLRCEFAMESGDGTLTLLLVGKKPIGEDWYGTWTILGGTGELAAAHGGGTWGGPGFGDPGPDCWYSGQVHFDP